MLLKLLRQQAKDKSSTHIVVSLMDKGSRGDEIGSLSELYCLNLNRGSISIGALYKLLKIIKSNNPDVIHSWMYHANILAYLVNLVFKKPLVWGIRCSLDNIKNLKPNTRLIVKFCAIVSSRIDRITYNSNISIDQHIRYGFSERNAEFIANGFELDKFNRENKTKSKMDFSSLSVPEGVTVLGHVARFHPMKNHKGFIRTIAPILRRKRGKLFCIMAGTNVDLNNRELVDLINELNVSNYFLLLGERADLKNVYHLFDFLVSPSLWGEGFPNVVGEAMSCGIPCIVSQVGQSSDIVGDCGYVYLPTQPDQLIACIETALQLTEEKYQELSEKCVKTIQHHYAIKTISDKYTKIYEKLVL